MRVVGLVSVVGCCVPSSFFFVCSSCFLRGVVSLFCVFYPAVLGHGFPGSSGYLRKAPIMSELIAFRLLPH